MKDEMYLSGKLRSMTSIYLKRINNGVEEVLLLYRIGSRVVAPSWCGIGGHVEAEEFRDIRKGALRELKEEIRLSEENLAQFELRYLTVSSRNGEIRHNYYFFAELRPQTEVELYCDEGILKWVPLSQVENLEMPFTAKAVLLDDRERDEKSKALLVGIREEKGLRFAPVAIF